MAQNRTEEGNPYRASGWLGILTAGKLWIDFKSDEQLEMRITQLLTECCSRLCKSGGVFRLYGAGVTDNEYGIFGSQRIRKKKTVLSRF